MTMPPDPIADLSERILRGDPRAVARAISLVEDETPEGPRLIGRLHGRAGHAYLVGVTGPPGAGKSTLVDRLTAEIRHVGQTVGVVAVDPTSPFSGGAILGDRIRMNAHALDEGVFVRSMATRGHLGGLARATSDATVILDASGKDIVVIETVGVGQDEVDIVGAADVSVVVLVPGAGDDVQALKAGIMEIADIFVVNKADREGADRVVQSVAAMLSLQPLGSDDWQPPILKTEATVGTGVAELWAAIGRFKAHAAATGRDRKRSRHAARLRELVVQRFMRHVEHTFSESEFQTLVDSVAKHEIDPYAAAADIVTRVMAAMPHTSRKSSSR